MRYVILTLALVMTLACAASMKQKVVVVHAAAETAFGAAQDAEIALYRAQTLPTLTPAVHIEVQQVFRSMFAVQDTVGAALQLWKPGEAPPASLTGWLDEAERTIARLQVVMPPNDPKVAGLWTQLRLWAGSVLEVARLAQVVAGPLTQALGGGR